MSEETKSYAPRLAKGLKVFLGAAKQDSSLKLSKAAIARRLGVHRDTLYEHAEHPEIAPLLDEIEELKDRRRAEKEAARSVARMEALEEDRDAPSAIRPAPASQGGAGTEAPDPGFELRDLPDQALERRIEATVRQITETMQRWVGHRRADRDVLDVVRVAYDLDEAMAMLHGLSGRLRPLAAEAKRRQRARKHRPEAPDLDFGSTPPASWKGDTHDGHSQL